jgi:protein SCO1/2
VSRSTRTAGLVIVLSSLHIGAARGQAAPDMEILPPPPREVGFDQNIGAVAPLDAIFKDETGKTVVLGDYFSDKPVVLNLAYFTCPMLCGLSMQGLSSSLKGIDLDAGRDFTVLTISFDPRETPDMAHAKKDRALADYGRAGADRGWHFLTGGEDAIARVTGVVGFRYQWDESAKQYAHATGLVVLTPDAKIARYLFGIEYAPKDLRLSLVEASKGRLGTLVDKLLLLCYHYDPKIGKYGLLAIGAMRMAGILTLVSLGLFVVMTTQRERKVRKARLSAAGAPARREGT